jgi:hypothetical protein
LETRWQTYYELIEKLDFTFLQEVMSSMFNKVAETAKLRSIGRAHTTGENGEWGETKQRSKKPSGL